MSESFATAFIAQYQSGVVVYANAGHPPALIVGDESERLLRPTGPLLGVSGTPEFDHTEVFLAVGQLLVAVTDGLIEAYGPAGRLEASDIAPQSPAPGASKASTRPYAGRAMSPCATTSRL